ILKRITSSREYHRLFCGVLGVLYVIIAVSLSAASASRFAAVMRDKKSTRKHFVSTRKGLVLHGFAFSLVGVLYSGYQVIYGFIAF
ncbi:hypothetical protein PFISCL1PPCAC_13678, partial [Pristionchus fissidentatus]